MRRRNRAGLKRIGVLALALVIAIGALGVSYTAWTEDLYINSAVQLGNLDIDVVGVSSTFVYKVPNSPPEPPTYLPETVVHYPYGDSDPDAPPGGTLIASAITENTSQWKDPITGEVVDTDSAIMTFSGIFPGIDFWADVELMYLGSIPARISFAEISPTSDATMNALWQRGKTTKDDPTRYGAWIDGEIKPSGSAIWSYVGDPLGQQLHQFDMMHIALHIRLPEPEETQFQNLNNINFTGKIQVIQYNMYED